MFYISYTSSVDIYDVIPSLGHILSSIMQIDGLEMAPAGLLSIMPIYLKSH